MLDNRHLNMLYQRFTINPDMPDEEVSDLSLEELSFIYATTENAKKDPNLAQIHFPIRQQIIYWAAVEALKKAEAIYVAYTATPMYPYIDPRGGIWVFSAEDLAQKLADDFKKKQYLGLVIRKIENNMILPFMAQLYYYGIDLIIVDNGTHPMAMKRSDILPDPEWNKDAPAQAQDFRNAPVQHTMIQFFQYIQLNSAMAQAAAAEETPAEEKEEIKKKLEQSRQVMKLMESRMLTTLVDAKFLVPTVTLKDGTPLPPGQSASGEGVTRKIANLVDGSQVAWLPAFTDWSEFAKTYKPNEWGAVVLDYAALVKMAQETKVGKIVFNARGCGFRVDENVLNNIEGFRQKKAEFEAKRAEEAAKKEAEGADAAKETASAAKPEAETAAPKAAAEPVKPQAEEPVAKAEEPAAKAEAVKAAEPAAEMPKKEEPVSYGDLMETPDMMIGALKRTAKTLKTVKKMWLASRIQGDKNGYLLVVEASDSERTIGELKRAVAGYLDGKELEVRLADPAALNIVKNFKPFYKKGLFG